jgi:hypothetical protein
MHRHSNGVDFRLVILCQDLVGCGGGAQYDGGCAEPGEVGREREVEGGVGEGEEGCWSPVGMLDRWYGMVVWEAYEDEGGG